MLHIDAELYNPSINGTPILSGDRINPLFGIAKQDLVEGDGISIEETSDGKIMISSTAISGVSDTIFSYSESAGMLKYLPESSFFFINTIPMGLDCDIDKLSYIDTSSIIYQDMDVLEREYSSSDSFSFSLSVSIKDGSYEDGQGILVLFSDGSIPSAMGGIDEYTRWCLHFDDSTADAKGNLATATVNGTASYASGKFGKGFSFDGSTTVAYPYNSSYFDFATTDKVTFEFLVKTSQSSGETFIYAFAGGEDLSYPGGSGSRFIFRLYNGTLMFRTYNGSWNDFSFGSIADGIFHHCAMVYDGNGTIKTYLDGVLITTGSFPLSSTGTYGGTDPAPFGTSGFIGILDEVRMSIGIERYTSAFTPPTRAFDSGSAGQTEVATYGNESYTKFLARLNSDFNDVAIGKTQDRTPTNSNVTIVDMSSAYSGKAGYFGSSGSCVLYSNSNDFNVYGMSAWTIDFCLYLNSMPSGAISMVLGSINPSDGGGWFVYVYQNGRLGIGINGVNEITTSAGTITTGTKYHVTIVKDSSTRIFINGINSAEGYDTYVSSSSAEYFRLGTFYAPYTLDGYLWDVRLCNVNCLATSGDPLYTSGSSFTIPNDDYGDTVGEEPEEDNKKFVVFLTTYKEESNSDSSSDSFSYSDSYSGSISDSESEPSYKKVESVVFHSSPYFLSTNNVKYGMGNYQYDIYAGELYSGKFFGLLKSGFFSKTSGPSYRSISTPTSMTGYSNSEWEITESGHYGYYYGWMCFNGLMTRFVDVCGWHSNNAIPAWVQWRAIGQSPSALIKNFYIIVDVADGYDLWYPINFTLQGSNDGQNWTTIITATGQGDWQTAENRGKWRKFSNTNNNTAYEYHRIYVSSSNGGYVSILEMIAYPDDTTPPEIPHGTGLYVSGSGDGVDGNYALESGTGNSRVWRWEGYYSIMIYYNSTFSSWDLTYEGNWTFYRCYGAEPTGTWEVVDGWAPAPSVSWT